MIETTILQSFTNFENKISELKKINAFPELILESNSISKLIGVDKRYYRFCIEQYSCFSNKAIHMLLDARINSYEWPNLSNEIEENISEELGKFTKNVPHLVMMRQGYKKDLNINTDYVVPMHFTQQFLSDMCKIFKTHDVAYQAGALMAFEGSAIAEFHIVESIMKLYLSDKLTGLTSEYIKGHQEFEIGHEQHLIDCIAPYIDNTNYKQMCKGYLAVCLNLNHWWLELYNDIIHKVNYTNLLP